MQSLPDMPPRPRQQPQEPPTRGDSAHQTAHAVISIEADGSAHGASQFFGREEAYRQAQQEENVEEALSTLGVPLSNGLQSAAKGGAAGAPPPDKHHMPLSGARVEIESGDEEVKRSWAVYFSSLPKKLRGGLDTRLPIPPVLEVVWSFMGAFLGIIAVSAMNEWVSPEIDIAFTVGSFGASAVLIYCMTESKMAQPRNFVGGQLISATVGITTRVIIHQPWIASPVAMSLALVAMMLTSTTHPPGGATALIAASFTELPRWHGYSYLITILVGSVIMQIIALVVNNLNPHRQYPTFWYGSLVLGYRLGFI